MNRIEPLRPCPHCGSEMRAGSLKRHSPICIKNPTAFARYREVLASEYTRIPLWREKPENIVGVLHAKDLLRAMRANEGDMSAIDASAIALPPWFVP